MGEMRADRPSNKGAVKRFLVGFLLIYMAVSIVLNFMLGPPGLSKGYLEKYGADHDRYLETTKLTEYKRWRQRSELVDLDEQLAERFAFVDVYSARPEFVAEQRRRGLYEILFDCLNVATVILLAVRFGRRPLVGLIDGMVDKVRAALEGAQSKQMMAAQRKGGAQKKLDGLPEERIELEARTAEQIEEMRREAAITTGERLAVFNRETEDRMRHEETLAQQALKRELVDRAIDRLTERLRGQSAREVDAALIEGFVRRLEGGA